MALKEEGPLTLLSCNDEQYILVHAGRWHEWLFVYKEELQDSLQSTWDYVIHIRKQHE